MKISKIRLQNFRGYRGVNELDFAFKKDKNISLVAGKNGFGKTTFLTALIWGFYGKLMAQVEDKYKREIKNSGGYDNYLLSLLNKYESWDYEQKIVSETSFFVEVELEDLLIPSIPCRKVTIKRTFDLKSKEENLSILIDGDENELTKEVGFEVFINDFILPREIAKFFFFDAEKIVSLAEAKSRAELRSLSRAYSEVLGIKKYEELKKNLESLLSKLRRNGVTTTERSKLNQLLEAEKDLEKQLSHNQDKQKDIDDQLTLLRSTTDNLQEKLIREGNGISLDQLKELKERQIQLKQQSVRSKGQIKKLLDIAPFVIAGKSLTKFYQQLALEQGIQNGTINDQKIVKELKVLSKSFFQNIEKLSLSSSTEEEMKVIMKETIENRENNSLSLNEKENVLLDFGEETFRSFEALYNNIKTSFLNQFKSISQEEKNSRLLLSQTNNKIKQAEARKDNPLAKQLRKEKLDVDKRIVDLEEQRTRLIENFGRYSVQLASHKKVLSEYEKKFNIVETDRKKYKVTEDLLQKINELILKIKEEKKYSLQKSIALNLKKLMHKKEFVSDVIVKLDQDIMDIDLLDEEGKIIDKDTMLSKGEQQLYATALLKALVEESGIEFPVFIDSPLQKFDNVHSINIIKEFYPTVSDQVVLFPLLEKELTVEEFEFLKPHITKTFLIKNHKTGSRVEPIAIDKLFSEFKKEDYVFSH
ncbi:MAG: hypothetical protein R3353_00955 [Salegentibacter mishustinae]|nr:hypothetical protein [Salegentibacter mishustinae]